MAVDSLTASSHSSASCWCVDARHLQLRNVHHTAEASLPGHVALNSLLLRLQVKDKPKSMLAAKSFEPINDMAAMERWIAIMADELAARMADDYEQHLRRPRNLIIHYRRGLLTMLAISCACCVQLLTIGEG